MEMADDYPDILVGCTGGGSNFSGLAFPFLGKKFRENKNLRVIACEPKSCPTLQKVNTLMILVIREIEHHCKNAYFGIFIYATIYSLRRLEISWNGSYG